MNFVGSFADSRQRQLPSFQRKRMCSDSSSPFPAVSGTLSVWELLMTLGAVGCQIRSPARLCSEAPPDVTTLSAPRTISLLKTTWH